MAASPAFRTRRVYEPPEPEDGTRVLVDRLWPRGLAKEDAPFDTWCKVVAPSTELRRWYGHEPERYEEFSRRYAEELREPERAEEVDRIRELARSGPVTLLTSTKDVDLSHLPVLVRHLSRKKSSPSGD